MRVRVVGSVCPTDMDSRWNGVVKAMATRSAEIRLNKDMSLWVNDQKLEGVVVADFGVIGEEMLVVDRDGDLLYAGEKMTENTKFRRIHTTKNYFVLEDFLGFITYVNHRDLEGRRIRRVSIGVEYFSDVFTDADSDTIVVKITNNYLVLLRLSAGVAPQERVSHISFSNVHGIIQKVVLLENETGIPSIYALVDGDVYRILDQGMKMVSDGTASTGDIFARSGVIFCYDSSSKAVVLRDGKFERISMLSLSGCDALDSAGPTVITKIILVTPETVTLKIESLPAYFRWSLRARFLHRSAEEERTRKKLSHRMTLVDNSERTNELVTLVNTIESDKIDGLVEMLDVVSREESVPPVAGSADKPRGSATTSGKILKDLSIYFSSESEDMEARAPDSVADSSKVTGDMEARALDSVADSSKVTGESVRDTAKIAQSSFGSAGTVEQDDIGGTSEETVAEESSGPEQVSNKPQPSELRGPVLVLELLTGKVLVITKGPYLVRKLGVLVFEDDSGAPQLENTGGTTLKLKTPRGSVVSLSPGKSKPLFSSVIVAAPDGGEFQFFVDLVRPGEEFEILERLEYSTSQGVSVYRANRITPDNREIVKIKAFSESIPTIIPSPVLESVRQHVVLYFPIFDNSRVKNVKLEKTLLFFTRNLGDRLEPPLLKEELYELSIQTLEMIAILEGMGYVYGGISLENCYVLVKKNGRKKFLFDSLLLSPAKKRRAGCDVWCYGKMMEQVIIETYGTLKSARDALGGPFVQFVMSASRLPGVSAARALKKLQVIVKSGGVNPNDIHRGLEMVSDTLLEIEENLRIFLLHGNKDELLLELCGALSSLRSDRGVDERYRRRLLEIYRLLLKAYSSTGPLIPVRKVVEELNRIENGVGHLKD